MDFLQFLNRAPSPYHARQNLQDWLSQHLQTPHHQLEIQEVGPGTLILWLHPHKIAREYRFGLAHTDSPTLRIKSRPDLQFAGMSQVAVEVYGSPLYNSWLDRDLGIAGLVAIKSQNRLKQIPIQLEWGIRIPQLAVHLDRNVNQEGLKLNPQQHLQAVLSLNHSQFEQRLLDHIPEAEEIYGWDLVLYDQQKASRGGVENEFVYSGRLDNLASCFALAQSLKQSQLQVGIGYCLGFFHHEEVGSESSQGAHSAALQIGFENAMAQFNLNNQEAELLRQSSLILSLDMAHAIHPNYPEKHDHLNFPLLGQGTVLKSNANQRYATDLRAASTLRWICDEKNLPLQDFHARNDMGCGSTVGPGVAARLQISCADVGIPMLSMHSAREMLAQSDVDACIDLLTAFFERRELP